MKQAVRWIVPALLLSIMFGIGFKLGDHRAKARMKDQKPQPFFTRILENEVQATPEQLSQIKELSRDKRKEIRFAMQKIRPEMMEINRRSRAKMRTILTPEQFQTFRKHLLERAQTMQRWHGESGQENSSRPEEQGPKPTEVESSQ